MNDEVKIFILCCYHLKCISGISMFQLISDLHIFILITSDAIFLTCCFEMIFQNWLRYLMHYKILSLCNDVVFIDCVGIFINYLAMILSWFTVYYCSDIHPEIVNFHNNSELYLFFFAIYVIYHFYIHHSVVENVQYVFIPFDYWLKKWFMFLFVSINQLYHVIWHFLEFLSDERQHENMIDHLK